MPRHARNSTAGTVYTYHEKKKDSKQCGYGTVEMRLTKDSIKEFDCCCLTLQPCVDPVVTPDGYLYDKEAILKCMLEQKREFARRMKAYENEKLKKEKEAAMEEQAKKDEIIKKFFEKNSSSSLLSPSVDKSSISNMTNGRDKQLPSFWLPSLTPSSKPTELQKPEEVIRCPMSGRPLKLKDLIEVKFTPIKDDGSKKSLIAKEVRYVCPVTNDVLGNSVPCAVLKTSGSVVTMECVERVIRKDMIDPTNGKKMREKDIIPLQRGSVGFAAAGVSLKASKEGAVMTA